MLRTVKKTPAQRAVRPCGAVPTLAPRAPRGPAAARALARAGLAALVVAGLAITAPVVDAKTRDVTLVEGDQPAVSPDGKTLAYRAWTNGNPEIFLVAIEKSDKGWRLAGTPRNWTNNSAPDGSPAWSPDGTRICFVSSRAGSKDLWVAAVDAPEKAERLTIGQGPEEEPAWSPDGRRLAYVGRDGGKTDLFTVPVAGGEPIRITDNTDDESHPTWSPDGQRLAFAADRAEGINIWMVDFGHAVERPGAVMDRASSGAPYGIYELTKGLFEESGSAWVPGTELVAFSSNRRNDNPIGMSAETRSGVEPRREPRADEPRRIFQVSTGPRPILTMLVESVQSAESPAWAPGAHDLFYVLTPRSSEREGGDSTKATIHVREGARSGK